MFNSIRWRLTLLMIALAILPLIAVSIFLIRRGFDQDRQQAQDLQAEVALRLSNEIEQFIVNRPREMALVTEVRGMQGLDRTEQGVILSELLAFDNNFEELALLSSTGQEVVGVSRRTVVTTDTMLDWSGREEFQVAAAQRTTYYGPVSFDEETGEPLMSIGVPLTDPRSGEIANVLVGTFRLRTLWDLIAAQDFAPGQDIFVTTGGVEPVLGSPERVIAHRNPSVVLGNTSYDIHIPDVERTGLQGEEAIVVSHAFQVGQQEFAVVSELTTEEAYRDVYATLYTLIASLGVIIFLSAVVGFLALRQVTRPIVTLAGAAQRLGTGDLSVQVNVRGRTELATLGRTFNIMAQQLRDVFSTLEARVQARTRDLQLAARVSEQMSTILDPDQLLPQVVEQVKANFNLYHAHLYLLEESGEFLRLEAGAGEAGRVMKAEGHRIPMQARSLVARAARQNQPVVVNNVREDPNFLANPLLPDTQAEVALPLAVANRVLGVLDVQSEHVGRFDLDAMAVLTTLAGQIAVSLENARLFSEVARTGQHEHTLSVITQEIQRATSMDEVLQAAARELGKALRVPRTRIQLRLPEGESMPEDGGQPVDAGEKHK